MPKDDLVYIGHMLDMGRKAMEKAGSSTREEYDADENLRMALTYLIQTVGEAARRVSPEFRARHPGIPWERIVGMRSRLVHDYLSVDYDLVWDVATVNLPDLVRDLEKIVSAG